MTQRQEQKRVIKIISDSEKNVSIDKQVESGCIVGACILAATVIFLGAWFLNYIK